MPSAEDLIFGSAVCTDSTLIGNILQIIFYGMSIVWIASAVSMMVIYAENQNEKELPRCIDGLYNRRQTDARRTGNRPKCRPNDDLLIVP